MKPEDSKDFAKEKPAEGQTILVFSEFAATSRFEFYPDMLMNGSWKYWQPWADPPKPDPFEEWFRDAPVDGRMVQAARKGWLARCRLGAEEPQILIWQP